jgi:hypothetical protein
MAKIARTDAERVVTVVLGTQWGDEGKGKVVDMLATIVDVCCRCQVSVVYYMCVLARSLQAVCTAAGDDAMRSV